MSFDLPERLQGPVGDLGEYFDSTYVNGPMTTDTAAPAAGGLRLLCRRSGNPMFDMERWNVYDATLENRDRTNNQSESFNAAFKLSVRCTSPGLWLVISRLQGTFRAVEDDIVVYQRGEQPPKRKHPKRQKMQNRRLQFCERRRDGSFSIEAFLAAFAGVEAEED